MRMLLVIILTLILSSFSRADSAIELIGGSITYHVIDDGASSKYVTKLNGDGRLIFNPLLGAKYLSQETYTYWSASAFTGKNSIGSYMNGAMMSYGLHTTNLYVGGVIGGYEQDDDAFRSQGIDPYRLAEINNQGLVPIVGVEINYKVDLNNLFYLKLNNILSPVITNTSLSIGSNL